MVRIQVLWDMNIFSVIISRRFEESFYVHLQRQASSRTGYLILEVGRHLETAQQTAITLQET